MASRHTAGGWTNADRQEQRSSSQAQLPPSPSSPPLIKRTASGAISPSLNNPNILSRVKRSFSSSSTPRFSSSSSPGPPQPVAALSYSNSVKSSLLSPSSVDQENHWDYATNHDSGTAKGSGVAVVAADPIMSDRSLSVTSMQFKYNVSPSAIRRSSYDTPGMMTSLKGRSFDAPATPQEPTSSWHRTKPPRRVHTVSTTGIKPAPAPAMYWSRAVTYGSTFPPALRAHTAVVLHGIMYIFGGTDKQGGFGKLYTLELDTFTWNKLELRGDMPPKCRAHSAVVDEQNSKIYIFGGGDGPNYFNHLFEFDANTFTWMRLHPSGQAPSPRRAHVSVIWKQQLYIFGGGDGVRALNDVHVYDIKSNTWSAVETYGVKPERRGYHTGTLVGDRLVIYGGSDGHTCFGDVHVLDLASHHWYPVAVEPPVSRLSHASVCVGSYLFVTGGHDGSRYCNELLMLNFVTMAWESRKIYGHPPTPRGYHSLVLYDSRLFLFGGYDGKHFFDDVFVLDLSSHAYLPQVTNFAIELP